MRVTVNVIRPPSLMDTSAMLKTGRSSSAVVPPSSPSEPEPSSVMEPLAVSVSVM